MPLAKTEPDAEEIFPVPQCGQLWVTLSPNRAADLPLANVSPLPDTISPETWWGQHGNP
jgi:hypothetical protein